MDLFTLYDWITSLLRPRAAIYHKSHSTTSEAVSTQQQQQQHQCTGANSHQHTANANIVVYSATAAIDELPPPDTGTHLVYADESTSAINNIELIPTLEFVSQTPQTSYEHLQQCLGTCCGSNHENTPPPPHRQHESATSSLLTYTVESPQTIEAAVVAASSPYNKTEDNTEESQQQQQQESSSSVDTTDLLRQQVATVSLTDSAASIYFDEPTSSISIEMMEDSQRTTPATTTNEGATTRTGTSTTDHLPASSTNTRSNNSTTTSHSYVPHMLTNAPLSSLSDEQEEIEEEIEEALELSEDQSLDFEDVAAGPSKKLSAQPEQLFGIEFSDISSNENSLALPDTGRSKQSSNDGDRLYHIDDDQLSGGKLAQHFVVNDEDDNSEELSLSMPRATPQLQSIHLDTEDSLELQRQQPKAKPQSSCNQSTSDDVSDLQDEPPEAEDSLLSELGYGSKEEDQMSLQQSIDKESQQEESSLEPFPSIPLLDIPQAVESEGEKALTVGGLNKQKMAKERGETSAELQETLQITKEAIGLISLSQENATENSPRVDEDRNSKEYSLEKPITAIELTYPVKENATEKSLRLSKETDQKEFSLKKQTTAILENSPSKENETSNSDINQARNSGSNPAATTTTSEKTPIVGEEKTEKEISLEKPITAIEFSSLAKENATEKSPRVAEEKNQKELSLEKSITAIQMNSPRAAEEQQKESSFDKQTTIQNLVEVHENPKLDDISKSINLERGESYASSTSQPTVEQISASEKVDISKEPTATTKTSKTTAERPLEFTQEDAAKAIDDLENSHKTAGTKAAGNPSSLLEILENPIRTPTVLLLAPLKKPTLPEFFENPNIKPLSGASSLHSEKDEQQSIEELLSLNSNSMEMTLEDHNVTSLNHSYIDNNQTLINELLKDSPAKGQRYQQETNDNVTTLNKYADPPKPLAAGSLAPPNSNATSTSFLGEQPPNLPHLQYATEYVEKTDFQQMEACGGLVGKPMLHSEIITDLDDSLQEDLPKTSDSRPTQPLQTLRIDTGQEDQLEDDEEEEDTSLQLMKLRIMAMKHQQPKEQQLSPNGEVHNTTPAQDATSQAAKPMERVSLVDFAKDVLEDITEESERNSLSTQEEQNSLNIDKTSTGRLNPSLALEAKDNNESISSNSILSLNMIQMLEKKLSELQQMLATKDACLASLNLQLENLQQRRGSSELMGSGRESSSLITTSTEYRTLQEDFGQTTLDIYLELNKRDELIAKLTDSLQQSLIIRENLQSESEKLGTEVQLLRKQLADAMETFKRPYWPPRVDQESQFGQRISEISMDLVSESDDDYERHYFTDTEEKFSRNSRERQLSMPRQFDYPPVSEAELLSDTTPFSKQIEQFQKYLTPSEVRLFFMVQKKFDDYLCQELEKCKMKSEQELKLVLDQWDTEKREKAEEIERLLSQRQEREAKHNQEMENLRKYFETKCADLEKQFSDDVFSQQSQRQGMSSTESSDQEQMPEDIYKSPSLPRSKESSPRKRTRAELLLSPSHRQMTPGNEVFSEDATAHEGSQLALEITELKRFYQNKIHDIQRSQEDNLKKLNDRLKYYQSRYPEDEFVTLLSETTADDQHWPKELILLREKFTAKSQLEIAQLQIKHAEEMSRLKQDFEKQLNRKNKRHSTFDSVRDFDKLLSERDNLRELSKTFRQVLSELLECVANCENDISDTLMEEVQRLLSCNRTLEEHSLDDYSFNATLLNDTLSTTKMRLIPDVHNLREVIEDPDLVQYISQRTSDYGEDFDLKVCMERLRSEASFLLHLSEDLSKKRHHHHADSDHGRRDSYSSGVEKNDSCCEQEDGLKLQQNRKFIRVNSLNEQELSSHRPALITQITHNLTSLPPDLNRIVYQDSASLSDNGKNAAELNFQVTELKNRLVKSENERLQLRDELEHTKSRYLELGQELDQLKDQLSQLPSLNSIQYNEGYGLGASMKSPQGLSALEDHNSTGFAQLQEKARNILSTPTQKQHSNDTTAQLLQMIEDFCREGDKVVECCKKDREDLQSQIDTADKQLKATRQFLEEQAIEREQEREEFLKEVGNLKAQLRDKEKELSSYANTSEEVEHLESQIRDINQKLQESNAKRDHFEVELKAYLDKTYVLREIITDLENQISTKAVNEQVMEEKVKHLEEYINSQNHCNEELQMEIQTLKAEIEHGYQVRIKQLEEKLQNIRPPAEQSIIMDQVVEQLKDIENTLEQKTKNLESLHQSTSSSVGSLSCPEDVSARGPGPTSLGASIVTPTQGSPIHPSPRQHSLTMEGVQRVVEKLSKHSRIEEAAVKRIRDLEMQVTQMRSACVELQYERESLQERMSEQTQRISALQSRLEEQRQRAEELQRGNTSDLNIRIHDLQNELQTVRETLSNRDKQIATMKQQLEKSKMAIDRLEAEVAVEHQPDRSIIERVEAELKLKQAENQKLKDKIKNEMINKLALPDLMETMLADKNEEIDHLKEQLEGKEKELQTAMEMSQNTTSVGERKPGFFSTKLSAGGTFSEIASISELDEPEVVRRTAAVACSPLLLPQGSEGYLHNTMDTSKGAVANLTHKRTEDLSGFTTIQQANTFDRPHYFQDPNILLGSAQSGGSATLSPLVPRQINFSDLTEDSKFKSSLVYKTPENSKQTETDKENIESLERQVQELKQQLEEQQQEEMNKIKQLQEEISQKTLEIERLTQEQDKWQREKAELMSKHEKNMKNLQESEELYKKRMHDLEEKLLKTTETEVNDRESLRKELRAISEVHEQCKYTAKDNESRKREIENLNQEIKAKDERLLTLSTKLSIAEDNIADLQRQIVNLEREVEKCKQQSSDNSSRQFSVDEVAQQIEKELNYSAQLDSNILKAIESEEENNLDRSHAHKNMIAEHPGTTDDENFVGERDLLNQLEALRAQIAVEREHAEELRQELLQEKHHSQEVQEQDVVIIEAMRKRLEAAMDQEEDLHKQLDIERERCDRLQTQVSTLQRTESRRNSSLLKSPVESPRKSPRSLMTDFESELAERLRSEIKLLTAQNERERERSADLQRNGERERSRYEKELMERIDYCDKLKREMEKVSRDKDNAEMEAEHLQERLMLQTQEIESLEARIASLQEAETRRYTRKEKHQKENVQLMAELQELKTQLFTLQSEKDAMHKNITQLRFDIERSAQREGKLAEALANANSQLAAREGTTTVPEQFLQKMKEINNLLAENTQENKQMAETVQYLVEERLQLQRKCEDLESQLSGTANVSELEERCNHLLGRYLRVESHRKALVYQKRYLKVSLQNYQDSEQRALAAYNGGHLLRPQRPKRKLFKTVALAIIAIQRLKYIGRIWHTGKRIVSKSVFTITQQKRSLAPTINCPAVTSTSPSPPQSALSNGQHSPHISNTLKVLERPMAPLKTPTLLNGGSRTPSSAASTTSGTAFEWPVKVTAKNNKKY